jgi:hypothetical protein
LLVRQSAEGIGNQSYPTASAMIRQTLVMAEVVAGGQCVCGAGLDRFHSFRIEALLVFAQLRWALARAGCLQAAPISRTSGYRRAPPMPGPPHMARQRAVSPEPRFGSRWGHGVNAEGLR